MNNPLTLPRAWRRAAVARPALLLCAAAALASCQPSADEKAAPLMHRIDSLYQRQAYTETLNAIRQLRDRHPQALKSRQRALHIWQEASLRLAQADIARTDSALQATIRAYEAETRIGPKNRLRVRRDSLQVRYDALCGIVRVIHRKTKK